MSPEGKRKNAQSSLTPDGPKLEATQVCISGGLDKTRNSPLIDSYWQHRHGSTSCHLEQRGCSRGCQIKQGTQLDLCLE